MEFKLINGIFNFNYHIYRCNFNKFIGNNNILIIFCNQVMNNMVAASTDLSNKINYKLHSV